jgi:hypothetical protein
MRNAVKWSVAAAMVAAAVGAVPSVAVAGGKPAPARVTGRADFALPFWPDDDVRSFTFDVTAKPWSRPLPGLPTGSPADATGTVRVSHLLAGTTTPVTFEAAVDCLITAPGTAALTAIVTRGDEPVRDWVGKRVGFSVQDGGRGGRHDRVGFTWSVSGDQNEAGEWGAAKIGTCLAPAPFAPVTRGDYTVHHADLTPPPAEAAVSLVH